MLSPADRDLVRRDRMLPGLATLLDPAELVRALRSALPNTAIERAEVTYLRYKPGMSCLAAFQLTVAGTAVGGYARTYSLASTAKLGKARQRPAVPSSVGPGRLVLEDRAIEAVFFPNDNKLDGLDLLMDDRAREDLLNRRSTANVPRLHDSSLAELRYKAERRYVAQIWSDGAIHSVLKAYTRRGYAAARNSARAFQSGPSLRLPALLARSRHHRVLAFEWLPGRLLHEHLITSDLDYDIVMRVGAALAGLHGQSGTGLTVRIRADEIATVDALADSLAWLAPLLARQAARVNRRIAAMLAAAPPAGCPIHGDFYPRQVLVDRGQVAVIDLDEAVIGDPAADLGLFIAHLERDACRGDLDPARVEPVREALLSGYGADAMRRRVDLYTALGLLTLAPHHFRNREPDWLGRTAATLHRAEEVLNQVDRIHSYPGPATGTRRHG